jgi:GT2 family glycosyltransferase
MSHSDKPTLCVINFNGATFLQPTLAAACALEHRFAAIVLIDNGSQDDSVKLIERDFPAVRIVRLPENLGAGGARNVGLREAPSDLILFIDNDVAITERCVDGLLSAIAKHPNAALAAAAIIYAHQRDTMQYDGAQCHFLGMQTLLDEDRLVVSVDPQVRSVGSLSTCCFLADRSRLPSGEIFDEVYFYIFEDHDFGVRVRMRGSEVLSVPAAHCYHGAGTLGLSIRQLGTYSSKRVYYLIRNRWLFLLKNFSARTLLVLTPLFLLFEVSQFFMAIKKGWIREWWNSVCWIAGNLPLILRERRRIQRLRTVPDRQILVGGRIPFRRELTGASLERKALAVLDAIVASYWKVAAKLV